MISKLKNASISNQIDENKKYGLRDRSYVIKKKSRKISKMCFMISIKERICRACDFNKWHTRIIIGMNCALKPKNDGCKVISS